MPAQTITATVGHGPNGANTDIIHPFASQLHRASSYCEDGIARRRYDDACTAWIGDGPSPYAPGQFSSGRSLMETPIEHRTHR